MNKFEKAEEHGRTQELSWSLLVFRHFRHFRHFRQDNVKTLEERADTEREREALRFAQTPMDLVSDCGT